MNIKYPFLILLLLYGANLDATGEELALLRLERYLGHSIYDDAEFESDTRIGKSYIQIAHDTSIISMSEIEDMGISSVGEALQTVPCVQVYRLTDFGMPPLIDINGSDYRHVTMVIEDVPVSSLFYGTSDTNWIPIGIVKRIEIVKDAASASWGQALGGVINIITTEKYPGKKGSYIQAGLGERGIQDHRASVFGEQGIMKLHLHVNVQDSGQLRNNREFRNYGFFSKAIFNLSDEIEAGGFLLYCEPRTVGGEYGSVDLRTTDDSRNLVTKIYVKTEITEAINFDFSVFGRNGKNDTMFSTLGLLGPENRYQSWDTTEKSRGVRAKMSWELENNTFVFGVDYERTRLARRAWLAGKEENLDMTVENTAIYLNDTIDIGNFHITPGIRLDDNSEIDDQINPCFGITYEPVMNTMFRISAARGFSSPPIVWKHGEFMQKSNPDLEAEKQWSYQAGFDTDWLKFVWLKGTLFYTERDNTFFLKRNEETISNMWVNTGNTRGRGGSFEFKTREIGGFKLSSGFSYYRTKHYEESDVEERYSLRTGLEYKYRDSFKCNIRGLYVQENVTEIQDSNLDDMIVDVNAIKNITFSDEFDMELFFSVRNLFNGSQYVVGMDKNADRWIEIGVK